jgi:hypothetical protein
LHLYKGKEEGQIVSISPVGMRGIAFFELDKIKKWGQYGVLGYGHKKE